jgi:glycosyltransferase involved in cell wall biosynthesis
MRPLLRPGEVDGLYAETPSSQKLAIVGRTAVRALRTVMRSRRYDAVWVFRGLLLGGPAVMEWLLSRIGPPIIFDFDDAIWITQTMEINRAWAPLKFPGRTAGLCRMAAAVVVGNEYLADYARKYNSNVSIVPSTVDTDRYRPRVHGAKRGPIVVGWSGSPTTAPHLTLVRGALRRLAAQWPIEMHIMGADWQAPGVPVVQTQWSPDNEVEELRSFDIGIMPLFDDAWTRGKGAMKALLYMAVGVPAVASPVGIASNIIQDGRNGFLAASEDEWVEKLLALAQDDQLRRRLGSAGRATVEREYSAKTQVPRVLEVLEDVVRRQRGCNTVGCLR